MLWSLVKTRGIILFTSYNALDSPAWHRLVWLKISVVPKSRNLVLNNYYILECIHDKY